MRRRGPQVNPPSAEAVWNMRIGRNPWVAGFTIGSSGLVRSIQIPVAVSRPGDVSAMVKENTSPGVPSSQAPCPYPW